MEVLYLLIPLALVLVAIIIVVLLWAIKNEQFEDLERHGRDILMDDDLPRSQENRNDNDET